MPKLLESNFEVIARDKDQRRAVTPSHNKGQRETMAHPGKPGQR